MKSGKVIKANNKGQIVIPKEYRDRLGITSDVPLHVVPHGKSLLLYPIIDIPEPEKGTYDKGKLLQALERLRGAWAESEDWKEYDKKEQEQRKLELKATREGKKPWW